MLTLEFSELKSSFHWLKFALWWGMALWNNIDRTLDRIGNGYRLCILGDINGWIGDRTRSGVIGAFGVSGENYNGRRVMELCAERGLCVGNTYFKHRSLHKYTRVTKVKKEWRF